MSRNSVQFTISNPAISFLLHDCVKSPHNQTGFLFGEIEEKVSNVTTDSHADNETIEITVSITATMPLPESEDLLFTRDGILNEDLLDTILGELRMDVVGWYSFTRNQDLNPSICQLFLAHQFSSYFSHIPKHLFLFFQMTTNIVFDENFTYTNKFLCTTGSDVSTPVELHIRQLGESSQAYNAHRPVTRQSESFDTVLNTLEWNNKDIVKSFETLQSLLCVKLNDQIDQHDPVETAKHSVDSDNHMQMSPEPNLIPEETMEESMSPGDDPTHPSQSGNPRLASHPPTNKTKPEGRVVPGKVHAAPSMGRGSRAANGSVLRSGRITTRAPSPGSAASLRTSHSPSPRPPLSARGKSPAPRPHPPPGRNNGTGANPPSPGVNRNNGTGPANQAPRGPKPSAPSTVGNTPNSRKANASNPTSAVPSQDKVRILARKPSLVNDSPPELNNSEESADGIEGGVDKSRDTYSSQEY